MRNLILSSSRLDDFAGCERKFNFTFLQGFKSKYENTTAMDKGSLFHKLAEIYYKAKKENLIPRADADFASTILKLVDSGRALGKSKYNLSDEDTELVVRTFRDYCTYYRFENYEIQEIEVPFSKVLFEDESAGLRVIINGTLDLLVKNAAAQEMVLDHKTKSRDLMPGALSNQFLCYSWATGRRYVLVNRVLFKENAPDETRFKRQPYEYTPRAVQEWATMVEYRARLIDKMNQEGYFPPNFKFCDVYGKCIFYDVCNQDPSGRVIALESDFIQSDEQYDDKRFE